MIRTDNKIRKKMYQNIKAYNNTMPIEYLEKLNMDQLFCFMHPIDRARLKSAMGMKVTDENFKFSNFDCINFQHDKK